MSIVDNRAEHVAAAERLSHVDDEQLLRELAHWAVTAQDQHHLNHDLREQIAIVQRTYAEAEAWVALLTEEMRARRGEAPERVGGGEVPAAFREALEGR